MFNSQSSLRFLVIGASGFIGYRILSYFKSKDYESLGTQRRAKYPDLITLDLLKDSIKDVIPPIFLKEKDKRSYAVICFALSQIDQCKKEKKLSYDINVIHTVKLISECVDIGIIPIFLSSDNVFDGKDGNYYEAHPVNPINEYGRQKVEVESFISNNIKESLVFRLSKIISYDQTENNLLFQWYKNIKDRKPILCIENQIFSPTFVGDIARGILLSCEKKLYGLYHIANSQSFLREQMAKDFVKFMDGNIEVFSKSQRDFGFFDPRPEITSLDSTNLINKTGISFTSVQKIFEAFNKNENWRN